MEVLLGSDKNEYTTDLQARSDAEAEFHYTKQLLSFLSPV
jgi:hypothetical protein